MRQLDGITDSVDMSLSNLQEIVRNLPAKQETTVRILGQEDPPEKGQATYSSILGLPLCSSGKEFSCNEGDLGSIPGLGRSPGERKGYPFQYSGLENSMDCLGHGVAKSRTQLSVFHFYFMQLLSQHMFQRPCQNTLWEFLIMFRYFVSPTTHTRTRTHMCTHCLMSHWAR